MEKSMPYDASLGALLYSMAPVLKKAFPVSYSNHEITACIERALENGNKSEEISQTSLTYLVEAAVRMAYSLDSGFSQKTLWESTCYYPLQSIYNLLNNRSGKAFVLPARPGDIPYPLNGIQSQKIREPSSTELKERYERSFEACARLLPGVLAGPDPVYQLLEQSEDDLSAVPSPSPKGEPSDISLYDRSKITALIAACISCYLAENQRINYEKECYEGFNQLLDEKAFLMTAFNFSGIQPFIYSISSKGALKGLRARSFYLEVLMENTVEELLDSLGLTRVNVVFTGGGSAHIVLPNTQEAIEKTSVLVGNINERLMEAFGSSLYLACAQEPCTARTLFYPEKGAEAYAKLFERLTAKLTAIQHRRYSPKDILKLNKRENEEHLRECSVCGSSARLTDYGSSDLFSGAEERLLCGYCANFEGVSNLLIRDDRVLAVLKEKPERNYIPLIALNGETLYLCPLSEKELFAGSGAVREDLVRVYTKNKKAAGIPKAKRLWMGTYAKRKEGAALCTFEELAELSMGYKRIGVLRADVDNLGSTFAKGFVRMEGKEPDYSLLTLPRTAALSRSLSQFFKLYLNKILEEDSFSLTGRGKRLRNCVIVYSGGDDLFLVGSWDDVLEAGVDIRSAFHQYTDGALSLSAGMAPFETKYPIALMADETALLEHEAKNCVCDGSSKDALSLFGFEIEDGKAIAPHTYSWKVFIYNVINEKLKVIREYYSCASALDADSDPGNVFLHYLLSLLKQAEKDKINIARLAYILARREPGKKAREEAIRAYESFKDNIYMWIRNSEDRRQLVTAVMLFLYTRRSREKEEQNDMGD